MKRREWLRGSAALGWMAALPASAHPETVARTEARPNPLTPPASGPIPVAFVISDGAVVIDFCGPWEVFQDVSVPGRDQDAFQLFTVAESTKPITASAGLKIVPDYTFATAPPPRVVVIPAQGSRSPATLEWIRKTSRTADVTMSVCTGALLLARTGLLAGKAATTHHASYKVMARDFPDVDVKRGARYVEAGALATAGGLSSGIDLALRVVERYYGRDVASATAYEMEYQGQGWLHPDSNEPYAQERVSTAEHPLCPVCEMDVDAKTAAHSVYRGETYYFCSTEHKEQFEASPAKYASHP